MSMGFELVVILLLILLNGIFAMSEMAMVSARRARLAVLERAGHRGAKLAHELSEDPQRFLPTVQIGITLVSILAGTFGGARIAANLGPQLHALGVPAAYADDAVLAVVVLAITFLTMVFGELVPKQLALRNPEAVALVVAGPLAFAARIGAPVVSALSFISSGVVRLFGRESKDRQVVSEDELKILLAEGAEEGILEHEERDMIERVLRLADKPVRAIMTPRNEIVWIDRSDPRPDVIEGLRETPHSRFVVCDGSVDNVVGVVLAKDLLVDLLDGKEFSISTSLRKALVMPDTVTALDALPQLRQDPLGIALVMDEYGSFEGLVTAADVLEAIIGDELTPAAGSRDGSKPEEAELLLDGMTPVDEIKARLGLPPLPAEGSYHTLAGLMLALLRRLPQVGDRITFAGWQFEILEMEGRRVARVRAARDLLAEG